MWCFCLGENCRSKEEVERVLPCSLEAWGDKGRWCVFGKNNHMAWSLNTFLCACLCGCVCCMSSMGKGNMREPVQRRSKEENMGPSLCRSRGEEARKGVDLVGDGI